MKNYAINSSIVSYLFLFVAVLSLTIVGCGDSGGTDSGPNPDPDPDPNPPAGASWDSGSISTGDSFSFTFDSEEMIEYICSIHPEMEGSVTVEEGAGSDQDTVIIDNLQFMPSDITIEPGTEVTWINEDNVAHTSTSR